MMIVTDFPIAASFPHFLGAEKSVQESIVGLKPEKDKHGSFVIIEPVSMIENNTVHKLFCNKN